MLPPEGQPVKMEWNPRVSLSPAFQGPSAAWGTNACRSAEQGPEPPGTEPLRQRGAVVPRKESDLPPDQQRFPSQWTKPQPGVSLVNAAASCITKGLSSRAVDRGPLRHWESLCPAWQAGLPPLRA